MRPALLLGLAAALAAFALPGAARDQNGVQKVVRTPLPYWQVGDIDKGLSRMCSLGTFNQRVIYKYSGQFRGPAGATLMGGAKGTGLNLFDPYGKADPRRDYWFFRDRTSACMVMSAVAKPGNGLPAVPAATPPAPTQP